MKLRPSYDGSKFRNEPSRYIPKHKVLEIFCFILLSGEGGEGGGQQAGILQQNNRKLRLPGLI